MQHFAMLTPHEQLDETILHIGGWTQRHALWTTWNSRWTDGGVATGETQFSSKVLLPNCISRAQFKSSSIWSSFDSPLSDISSNGRSMDSSSILQKFLSFLC